MSEPIKCGECGGDRFTVGIVRKEVEHERDSMSGSSTYISIVLECCGLKYQMGSGLNNHAADKLAKEGTWKKDP